ncbi:MAG TPA: hypothetical protein VH538_00355 [Gaiellaceae bacterium]
MPVRLVSVVALAGLFALVAAVAGSGSPPGDNGRIVFGATVRGAGLPAHVYSVEPDGTGLTQLTSGTGDDSQVAAAPDGGRLLVERDTHEQCGHVYWAQGYDLFLMGTDGRRQTRLTDDCPHGEFNPAWSPSGAHVLFSRDGTIWSMRSDGSDEAQLTCQGNGDYFPAWSPDGRTIAFTRNGDEIELMNADGSDVRRFAAGTMPAFSPDGSQISFAGVGPGEAQGIYAANVDGGDARQLTTGDDDRPVWAPDGTRIVFIAGSNAPSRTYDIDTIAASGGDERTVMSSLDATWVDWAARPGAPATATEPDVTPGATACSETPQAAGPQAPTSSQAPVAAPAVGSTVPAAAVAAPDRLVVASVSFAPRILRVRRAFEVGIRVRDQRGRAVSGAVVRITPLDGRARASAALRTGPSGAVSVKVVPTRLLELRPGRRLTLEVRVRRPGDPWAAAVSGSRLVSIRIASPSHR